MLYLYSEDNIEQSFYYFMSNKLTDSTRQNILTNTKKIFANQGFEGISMRHIANLVGIAPSVLYYYFADKDELLKEVYLHTNVVLGHLRAELPELESFEDLVKQRIAFQLDQAESVCAVLKYYLHFRTRFEKNESGHLPEKAYLHIEEILVLAEKRGLYRFPDLKKEAKVIVHAINGFVLEYFPAPLSQLERDTLIETISDFILRALKPHQKVIV